MMKKKYLAGLAAGMLLFICISATAMAYEWSSYNGHWYTLSNNETWAAAEAEAGLTRTGKWRAAGLGSGLSREALPSAPRP